MPEQRLAERINDEVVVQPDASAVRWEIADLVARDGHVVRIGFAARVRALPDPAERRMLAEALLSRSGAVTVADVRRHFQPTLRIAAGRIVGADNAAALVAGDSQAAIEAALVQAARSIAFASGIDVLPPFELNIDSPTLAVQRQQALQRQHADDRQRHRRRVEQAVAAGQPIVSDTLVPQEFAAHMAAAMDLAAAQAPHATLVAASGQGLAMVGINNGVIAPVRLIPMTADLGPLRSVRRGDDGRLLVGAQRGVLLVALHAPDDVAALADPGITSDLGFNDAVNWRGGIWACHGEGGLVAWDEFEAAEPARSWRVEALRARLNEPDATPRYLTPLNEDRMAFAMGGRLCTVDAEGEIRGHADSGAAIMHLSAQGDRLLMVRGDGGGEIRDRRTLAERQRWAATGAVAAGAVVRCLGECLVLMAGDDGTVFARGLQESTPRVIRQFLSTARSPRRLIATARYIAALAPDRQRVVLWQSTASEALLTLHLTPQTRHRVADVCWVEG